MHPGERIGDGFHVFLDRSIDQLTVAVTHWSAELDTALRDSPITRVVQHASWMDGTPVLPKLTHYAPQIRSLSLTKDPAGDLAILNEFANIESLALSQPGKGVAYAGFAKLRSLYLYPGAILGRATDAPALESLCLWSIPIKSLSVLAPLQRLRALDLRQIVALKSLDGIDAFPLEHLTLSYVNRLQSIAPLGSLDRLQRLDIDGASKAAGGDVIRELTALKVLELDNGPALPSLDGFDSLASLESMRVFNTPIGTGPCPVAPLGRLQKLWQLFLCGRPKSLSNLTGWEHLGESPSLRVLALDRVGDVPTFGWMRSLKTLENLSVLGANLVDRDLSPLFDLPALSQLRLELKGMKEGTHFGNIAEELFAIADARVAARRAAQLSHSNMTAARMKLA